MFYKKYLLITNIIYIYIIHKHFYFLYVLDKTKVTSINYIKVQFVSN